MLKYEHSLIFLPMKKNVKIKRHVRRDQVARAALAVIARTGVKALTTAAIAREAGISEANLYNHFRNKEDILLETIGKIGQGLEDNVASVLQMSSPPMRRLERLFRLHLEHIERNPGIPRLVYSDEIHLGRAVREKLLGTIGSYIRSVESLVKAGQRADAVRRALKASSIAALFLGLIQLLTIRWSLADFSFSLAREGKQLWKDFSLCIAPAEQR
jgi:TetR/AcrR family fatty acid metabolism transcriptional regulator